MESTRQDRVLEIFFRALRGEDIIVSELANEYSVATKSISRNISDLKAFLADHIAITPLDTVTVGLTSL